MALHSAARHRMPERRGEERGDKGDFQMARAVELQAAVYAPFLRRNAKRSVIGKRDWVAEKPTGHFWDASRGTLPLWLLKGDSGKFVPPCWKAL